MFTKNARLLPARAILGSKVLLIVATGQAEAAQMTVIGVLHPMLEATGHILLHIMHAALHPRVYTAFRIEQ